MSDESAIVMMTATKNGKRFGGVESTWFLYCCGNEGPATLSHHVPRRHVTGNSRMNIKPLYRYTYCIILPHFSGNFFTMLFLEKE